MELVTGDPQVHDIRAVKIQGFYIGMEVPDFEFTRSDGTTGHLSDFRGQVVLLDFWATWCAPCLAAMPKLAEAQERYEADGFVLLLASVDAQAETLERFLKQRSVPGTVFHAPGGLQGELARLFNVEGVPTNLLIGRDGKVRANDLDPRALDSAIRQALRDVPADGGDPPIVAQRG